MPQMTDPFTALESFQEVLANDVMSLQPGIIDPELFVHLDHPNGSTRFTYVRLDRRTVTALAMFVQVGPSKVVRAFRLAMLFPRDTGRRGVPRILWPPPLLS
jgi:hypothetical protein